MKRYLPFCTLALVTLCRLQAAEQVWTGIATDKVFNFREKKQIDVPSLEVGKEFFLLTGKELVAVDDLKKSRYYVVTGTLSKDGKTINVTKMVPRTDYEGIVYVGKPGAADIRKHFLILHVDGRAWRLHGKLPDFSTIKDGTKWKVDGTEDDDNKWITVTSMSATE